MDYLKAAFVPLLILVFVSTAEENENEWINRLAEPPQCNDCAILTGDFFKMTSYCTYCFEPVETQFRKISACNDCYTNSAQCPVCQREIMERLEGLAWKGIGNSFTSVRNTMVCKYMFLVNTWIGFWFLGSSHCQLKLQRSGQAPRLDMTASPIL